MSDDSSGGIVGFLAFIAAVYVALNQSAFLEWAATLQEPFSGLAWVLIWAVTIYAAIVGVILGILFVLLLVVIAIKIAGAVS